MKLTKFERFLGIINLLALGWNVSVLFSYLILLRVGKIDFNYLALFSSLFKITLFGLVSYYIIKKRCKMKENIWICDKCGCKTEVLWQTYFGGNKPFKCCYSCKWD